MLPAMAVERLDPPAHVLAQAPDTPTFYLCLGADNKCAGGPKPLSQWHCQATRRLTALMAIYVGN